MTEKNYSRYSEEERERLIQAKKYILDHLHLPIKIKELEKITAMNKEKIDYGFLFLFERKTAAFIKETRMQTALFLLRNTNKTIKDIAAAVGYRYDYNFLTAFRKFFNFTANSVRKDHDTE